MSNIATALAKIDSVTTIRLDDCDKIFDADAASLANALEVNNSIIKLSLGHNQIGDAGAASLARALEVNKSVIRLSLGYNQIGDAGTASLAKALIVNKGVGIFLEGKELRNAEAPSLVKTN